MGVAPNASTWFIQFDSSDFWTNFADWVNYLGSTEGVPFVHSVSWGSSQFAGGFPSNAYRVRLETELQKVGLRGITVLIASGDNGVGCDNNKCKFLDDYPAESKFVTAVGATGFITGNTGPERAVNYPDEFTSGGGFSWLFSRPAYQNKSVNEYLSTVQSLPPSPSYNHNGRATADFSALGSIEFEVVIGGSTSKIGGTSASCPTFAGIVTLLNDVRLNHNQPTLGFLNPLFYQIAEENPAAFFDVTVGNNNWPCDCSTQNGFNCAKGWDPATGIGTPNFAVLKSEVLKMF
jgi:tripeptidyl-peptidase-1